MGKNKYIESPEKLWELFIKYVEDKKNKPKLVQDFVGKDATEVNRRKEVPLTLEGFENFVADIPNMPLDLSHYFANTNDAYSDYLTICSRIRRKIRQDQIEGGMVGIYNPSITQRLNNLTERTSTEISGSLNIPKMSDIGNR